MAIQYKALRKGRSLLVELKEEGVKRILYLDTLKSIARLSDKEPLELLIKIHRQTNRNLETLSFQKIEVPPIHAEEALKLMRKTGRLIIDESQILEKPLAAKPLLILKDESGCFANLWIDYEVAKVEFDDFAPTVCGKARLKKEEMQIEKDLLESGFSRKIVGECKYYCSSEKVKGALELLLAVGWNIQGPSAQSISAKIRVSEENGRIVIRPALRGLIDQKIQLGGTWENGALYLKKSQVGAALPMLQDGNIDWDENLRKLAAGLAEGACLEQALPAFTFQGELLPYQQKGVDWLQFLYHWGFSALLADEMGLGKTVQVLAFFSRLRTNLPVLIVAPTTLLFNWRAEIAKFLPSCHNFRLISYTALRLNVEEYAKEEFEVVVLDESNAIKTASTQTARAACKLKARMRICLSGTPMENRPDEIWSQFHFLMPDLVERNFNTLKGQIRPFILRRKKEQVQLDLPEKIEQIAWIEMDEDQAQVYENYKKGIQLHSLNKMQVLEAILRLRQICCDPRLVGSDAKSAKLEQLVSDVQEGLEQGRKILVYSQFTQALQLIRKEFPQALYLDGSTNVEERGKIVQRFQEDPNCSLFLLSLKAGGVGLNLTAADYVFLFDPWWNEAVERQAIDRAHRIGQKNTVFAKRYLTINTIEEKMQQMKQAKTQAADQLLDMDEWSQDDLLYLLT